MTASAGANAPKGHPVDTVRLRRVRTAELSATEVAAIRTMLEEAFGPDEDERFTDDDWDHAIGGLHVIADIDGAILAHASVVGRTIRVAGRPLRTGYVEAVATARGHQGSGLGTRVMEDVGAYIRDTFELGALGTGVHGFYERLGWVTWRGPTSVLTADGESRTTEDDGSIMVLRTPTSPALDLSAPIQCEWRPGHVW
jgi:aminoglycoside 2'-N-acetyltransferase I